MRATLLCLVGLLPLLGGWSEVHAHDFTICKGATDHLHVSKVDVTPDKPKAGAPLSLSVVFTPDAKIAAPLGARVGVKVFGVKVFSTEVEDLCSYLKGSDHPCPFEKGTTETFSFSVAEVPEEVPSNVEASIEIAFFSGSTQLSCIDTKIDTASLQSEETATLRGAAPIISEKSMRFLFSKWLEQFHHIAPEVNTWFKKDDPQSKATHEGRFKIFAENLLDIVAHNIKFAAKKVTYAKKMNQFGHLTGHEFKSMYLTGYRRDSESSPVSPAPKPTFWDSVLGNAYRLIPSSPSADIATETKKNADSLPAEWDWVEKGAVTHVKNQGGCGSCWAFSAVAALEGAYFIKYGVLKEFSEQELVSCDTGCYGCRGGLMDEAFNWIHEHGGLCSESDYPYTSGDSGANGFCKIGRFSSGCTPDPQSQVSRFVNVGHTEEAVKAAVAQQPVSVAVEADQYSFQFYSHGVLTTECGDRDDHGVLVVGYGNLDGVDFWKVKNSWGPSWGMDGYVLIQRGKQVPTGDGECGILVDPVYPVL